MQDIIALATPFFGLILLGYIAARIFKRPEAGLAWLNIFIVYFALPALFIKLVGQTPFEELSRWSFVFSTTFATYAAFTLAFIVGFIVTRGRIDEATIQAVAGSYSNVGYMGPGITLAALGPAAAVPTALIFCFDNALLFTCVPLLMAFAGNERLRIGPLMLAVAKKVFLHPFIVATLIGVVVAYFQIDFPEPVDNMMNFLSNAAAPCALFVMGISVALRPLKRVPWELPFLTLIKLVIHPAIALVMLSIMGNFDPVWVYAAVLMAALPPALNVFVLAQQYDTYVQRASSAVLVGTVVSVFTLTTALYLTTHEILPADLFP
ncbi:AEC family transporter [Tepidamorphus sp. 3E244]|uniref:AEC family transporter n=1 Tax=Tepidamorphus sp. 3E244 TaxID=3385498 RepID=UPI0038FC122B